METVNHFAALDEDGQVVVDAEQLSLHESKFELRPGTGAKRASDPFGDAKPRELNVDPEAEKRLREKFDAADEREYSQPGAKGVLPGMVRPRMMQRPPVMQGMMRPRYGMQGNYAQPMMMQNNMMQGGMYGQNGYGSRGGYGMMGGVRRGAFMGQQQQRFMQPNEMSAEEQEPPMEGLDASQQEYLEGGQEMEAMGGSLGDDGSFGMQQQQGFNRPMMMRGGMMMPLQRGPRPPYICRLCYNPGHYIRQCPYFQPHARAPNGMVMPGDMQQRFRPMYGTPDAMMGAPNMFTNKPLPDDYCCKICTKSGHWIWECPEYKPGARRSLVPPDSYVCDRCNIAGHWKQNCPRLNEMTDGAY